jgi:hypothetical protein
VRRGGYAEKDKGISGCDLREEKACGAGGAGRREGAGGVGEVDVYRLSRRAGTFGKSMAFRMAGGWGWTGVSGRMDLVKRLGRKWTGLVEQKRTDSTGGTVKRIVTGMRVSDRHGTF